MSIIDNFKKKRGAPSLFPNAPTAPAIQDKIDAVRSELDQLIGSLPQISLDVECDVDGAADRLVAAKRRRAELDERIVDLEAAHQAASKADALERQRARAAAFRHQLKRASAALDARDAAAADLAKTIENMMAAYQAFWRASRKVPQGINPNELGALPQPSLTTTVEIDRLLFDELLRITYRHPVEPVDDANAPTFAGLKSRNIGDPRQNEPLAEHVARTSAWMIEVLSGREQHTAPPRPAPEPEPQEVTFTGTLMPHEIAHWPEELRRAYETLSDPKASPESRQAAGDALVSL